jgi:predicted PurR-regulated permease PerM
MASNFALGFLVLMPGRLYPACRRADHDPLRDRRLRLVPDQRHGAGFVPDFRSQKMHLPRFFCFLFAILFLVAGIWFIFEVISDNVAKVAAAAPLYQKNLELILPQVMALLHLEQEAVVRELMQYLNLGAMIAIFAKMLTGIAGKTLVVLFYTGFLLYEQRFFHRKISGMVENA